MPGNNFICLGHDAVLRPNWNRFALIKNEEGVTLPTLQEKPSHSRSRVVASGPVSSPWPGLSPMCKNDRDSSRSLLAIGGVKLRGIVRGKAGKEF